MVPVYNDNYDGNGGNIGDNYDSGLLLCQKKGQKSGMGNPPSIAQYYVSL